MDRFQDRQEAGKQLASLLKDYKNRKDILVLALPRGGVPVGYEIAKSLNAPLDVFIVRKLGVPGHEELAMGALAMGGVTVFNEEILEDLQISQTAIDKVIKLEQKELERREEAYRGKRPFPSLNDKTIILVDDGIATGATMLAAVKALRQLNPAAIIIAVPVAESTTCDKMANLVEKIYCPLKPRYFYAVGAWYVTFDQTSDAEVYELLNKKSQHD